MNRTLITIIAIFLSFAAHGNDEIELRKLKTQLWNQAYRTQDVDLLDSILHESFQMIDAVGKRSNKTKELAYIQKNEWNPPNFKYTIERLEIYEGKFAIVDGVGDTDTYSYTSSNVLIKEDGRWQAIASHVSGYSKKVR